MFIDLNRQPSGFKNGCIIEGSWMLAWGRLMQNSWVLKLDKCVSVRQ